MWCDVRTWMFVGWVLAAQGVIASFGFERSGESHPAVTASAPARDECEGLQDHLAAAEKALTNRRPALRQRLEAIASALADLEARRESIPASELGERRDRLIAERAGLQNELKFLESAGAAWQAALDACESTTRFREELERFRTGRQRKADEFVSGDLAAIQAQLDQLQNARTAVEEPETVLAKRLAKLAELIEEADEQAKRLLKTERSALSAQSESTRHKRAALDAAQGLLEAKLAAATQAVGELPTTQPEGTTTAPAADEADALNKQRLAEQLEAEARDRLAFARACLEEIQGRLEQASDAGLDAAQLENDREYWQRAEGYEQRRLKQATLHQRAAQEKKAIAHLLERIDEAGKSLEQLRQTRLQMSQPQRQERAARFTEQADAARQSARGLEQRADAEGKEIQPLQQLLPSLDAIEEALRERLQQAVSFDEYRRRYDHFRRMKHRLDVERQQIDLMVATLENVVYAIGRQASLERTVADLYMRCADVLVPPVPSFRERHRKIINSIMIVAAVIAISYVVKLAVWLMQRVLAWVNAALGSRRFSVRRAGTLLSFAGSIIKLFVWIFGVVAVFKEFDVDPAKSAGAIGLIGLIMAGMFQQIVVDFVKGLDIVAGRHYNVGDFVEVDGKRGHVVDFNVKHTRIRTLSGQEFNIPNSRCVPSRRFPDGYVDNYVDITLKSPADADQAKKAIGAVCPDLNQRVEPIRDEPALAWRFAGPHGRVTLRYRVRVLPGCDWVVTDYFIPAAKEALAEKGIEPAAEPTFFFINRIETFRRLFSRRLSEEQILREVAQNKPGPTADESASQPVEPDSKDTSRRDEQS